MTRRERYVPDDSRTQVMGILNVTPDSFSDGGMYADPNDAIRRAKEMVEDGADIIDIGGESSRPGAAPVPEALELERVLPVIKGLAGVIDVPMSIDTYKPRVAEECITAGASIINDISGLRDPAMADVAAGYDVPVILMHMRGTPETMQDKPEYGDVIGEIKDHLGKRIAEAHQAGVRDIIVDPGIGFGKTMEHNLTILDRLREFRELGCPIVVGPSRKSFIRKTVGDDPGKILAGTIASVCVAAINGADIVRVHDVKECRAALDILDAMKGNRPGRV